MRISDLRENRVRLPRRWQGNVGKSIGGSIYVHRDYESEVVPQEVLQQAYEGLDGFEYNIVKYTPKAGAVTFIQSPDFDTADEPTVGPALLVKPDGSKRLIKPSADPWIYHHKWLWVKDDYPGFDVGQAKRRSEQWMSLPGIDYSRIGKKSFWEKKVLPRLQ